MRYKANSSSLLRNILFTVSGSLLLLTSLSSCNSGSSSSSYYYSIEDLYTDNVLNPGTCQFSNTTTSCVIYLSYNAEPATGLGTSGITSPYTVTNNNCGSNANYADCEVTVSYTPQSTLSEQTLTLTVGSAQVYVPMSNSN